MGRTSGKKAHSVSVRLLVLRFLADGPDYGLNIQRRIRKAANDRNPPSISNIYGELTRLSSPEQELVHFDGERPQDPTHRGRPVKIYSLTPKGREALQKSIDEIREFFRKAGTPLE